MGCEVVSVRALKLLLKRINSEEGFKQEKSCVVRVLTSKQSDLTDEVRFLAAKLFAQYRFLFTDKEIVELFSSLEVSLTAEQVKAIRQAKVIKFKFPVVKNGKGAVASAFVIPLENFSEFTVALTKFRYVANFGNVSKCVDKGFIVATDKDISGDSYQLALALALTVNNLPEDVIYTGAIDSIGNIIEVDHIKEKKEFAESNGQYLCYFNTEENITLHDILDILNSDEVRIPFMVSIGNSDGYANFTTFVKSVHIQMQILKVIGLEEKDLFFIEEQWVDKENKAEMLKIVEIVSTKIKNIKNINKDKKILLACRGFIEFGFILGALLSGKINCDFYHYDTGKYCKAITEDLLNSKYKQSLLQCEKYPCKDNKADSIVCLVDITGKSFSTAKKMAQEAKCSFFNIHLAENMEEEFGKYIPVDKHFAIAREVYSRVKNFLNTEGAISTKLCLAVPISVAFGLGWFFGVHSNLELYTFVSSKKSYSLYMETNSLLKYTL